MDYSSIINLKQYLFYLCCFTHDFSSNECATHCVNIVNIEDKE